jgi:hypothetical protein
MFNLERVSSVISAAWKIMLLSVKGNPERNDACNTKNDNQQPRQEPFFHRVSPKAEACSWKKQGMPLSFKLILNSKPHRVTLRKGELAIHVWHPTKQNRTCNLGGLKPQPGLLEVSKYK